MVNYGERWQTKFYDFQMKTELDAFDPNFFEELEDLKYNYQEAVHKNVQYEEQLNSLAKQHGFTLDTWQIWCGVAIYHFLSISFNDSNYLLYHPYCACEQSSIHPYH